MTAPHRPATVETIARGADRPGGRVRLSAIEEPVDVERIDESSYRVRLGERQFEVVVAREPGIEWGWVDGRTFRWAHAPDAGDREPESAGDTGTVRAPMPAVVTAVAVAPGQVVARGETLVTLEAMKMELPLKAPHAAVVTAVRCGTGDRVYADAPLVELGTRDSVRE